MDTKKRNFLAAAIPLAIGMPFGLLSMVGFRHAQTQEPRSFPGQGPTHQPLPDNEPKINPKDVLKQNQKQIRDDVEKLYELAGELKDEVEKTDATNTLSLPMIQKAEQIEKLAKQVKNLTRAN